LYPQADLRKGSARIRAVSRRFRHTGRNIRGAYAHADGKIARHSRGPSRPATRKLLGDMDEISYRPDALPRVHFTRRLFLLQNHAQRPRSSRGDLEVLQDFSLGALGWE